MAGIPGVDIAGDLVSGGISLYEYLNTKSQLNTLDAQPMPEEKLSPELKNAYGLAQNMASEGYTPEEKAAFQANQNRASNTNYQKAVSLGGNQLGNVLQGTINADVVGSYDQFAAKDAELHRQNITNLETEADKIQDQKNKIQDERIAHRNLLETTLGNSNKTALEGIMKSFALGGTALLGGGGKGGGGTNGDGGDGTNGGGGYYGGYYGVGG